MPKRRGIMDYALTPVGQVLSDILDERVRQDDKWGVQDHDQMIWLGILAEEFGEAAKEINELHFRPGDEVHIDDSHPCKVHRVQKVREELIQVAAVAVAMIESLDRNGK